MPPSPGHSARVRAEIFQHAARLFRLRGYAGTNIDDIMLAAGLTRGAFYAHFKSKDDLFAEVIGAGHGLLVRMRAGDGKVGGVIDGYLAKDVHATLRDCTLAALAGDVARAPLPAQLAYANVLHGLIGEMARGRGRKLDADATAAAILAVGGLSLAQASGDRRLSDWLLRCARRAARALLAPKKPAPGELRQSRNDPAHAGKPLALVGPDALHDHAVVGPELHQRRILLDPADQPVRLGELVLVEGEDDAPSRRRRSSRRWPARHSSLSAMVFSRNSASGGVWPKRSTSSAAKESTSAWSSSPPSRR